MFAFFRPRGSEGRAIYRRLKADATVIAGGEVGRDADGIEQVGCKYQIGPSYVGRMKISDTGGTNAR